jgi:MAPEG family protein
MTPLLSLVVYMAIVTWASLLAASLIRAEGWTLPGMMLATGNRDDLPVPSPLAGRADRAARNTAHNFMLFDALAVVAHHRCFRRIRQRPAGARRVDRLVKRREDPRFSKLRAYAVPVEIRA